jgi:hypothetical protein
MGPFLVSRSIARHGDLAGLAGGGRLAGPAARADRQVEAEAVAEALDPGGVAVGQSDPGAAAEGGQFFVGGRLVDEGRPATPACGRGLGERLVTPSMGNDKRHGTISATHLIWGVNRG